MVIVTQDPKNTLTNQNLLMLKVGRQTLVPLEPLRENLPRSIKSNLVGQRYQDLVVTLVRVFFKRNIK